MDRFIFDMQRFANISNYTSSTVVSGTSYADSIYNTSSRVTINAGAGNDTIVRGYGDYVSINAGAGNDNISLNSSSIWYSPTINGGTGDDTIYGNSLIGSSSRGALYQYSLGDGYDIIYGYTSYDKISITGAAQYARSTVGSDVVINILSGGAITLGGASGKTISIIGGEEVNYIANSTSNTLISGTSSADTISNSARSVTINAGAGNDSIKNDAYYVTMNAGDGADTIYNASGDYVSINAGAGNDSIYGYSYNWNDTIIAGDGDDTITGFGRGASIDAGAGNDRISLGTSSSTAQTVKGGTGNDTIYGSSSTVGNLYQYTSGDGYDSIVNFKARDTLQIGGGTGTYSTQTSGSNIVVTVGDGKITLQGAASLSSVNIAGTYSNINIIENSTSSTMISGTSYADSISNYGSNVTISGNSGNDSIYNNWNFSYDSPYDDSDGSNVLFEYYYGDGDDIIYGFKENSTLQIDGGSGFYYTYQSGSDIIVTVEDESEITLVGAASLSYVNIDGYYEDDEESDDDEDDYDDEYEEYDILNRASSTVVNGTSYSDYIYNNGDNVTIYAGEGFDYINNLGEYVVIDAGAGNDTIYTSYNVNYVSMSGGTGNDSINNYSAWDSTINAGDGDDTIIVSYRAYRDSINTGAGNDLINLGTGTGNGYNGKNTIVGGTGNDIIYGNSSSSDGNLYQYTSGDGNDVIYSFNVADTLQIGGGSGTYSTQVSGSNIIVTVGEGYITLFGAANLSTVNIAGTYSAIISNSNSNTLVSGTSYDDTIYNYADTVTVQALSGDDSIYGSDDLRDSVVISGGSGNDDIEGRYANSSISGDAGNDVIIINGAIFDTILGGAGNDTIGVSQIFYSSIDGEAENDIFVVIGYGNTISGGTGNDSIINGYESIDSSFGDYEGNTFVYSSGDGNDVIYNFSALDTLQIGGGSGTYSKQTSGSDLIVTIGDGKITLLGAANLSNVNINGTDNSTPIWRINGTTATYGTTSNALITVTGVKSTDGLSLNGSTVTIANSALNGSNVTVSNGYYLALANDVPITSTTAAGWTLNGTTATYKAATTSAGYALNNNQITYTAAGGGNALVNVTGVKSTNGITLNGSTVTVANSALNGSNVTVSNGYYLALANDVPITSTTAAGWTLNGTTATYKAATTSAGYALNNNQITYTAAGGGNALVNVTGVKSTNGITLNGSTVTVANSALNGSNVTVSNGYYLALANDVPITSTTAAGWTLNGTTATYKAAATSAGYALNNNQITYTAAGGGNALVNVTGVNSTNGITLNGSTVTVANSALNGSNVTVSNGYYLALANDVPITSTTAAGWALNGTTATYKAATTSAGYTLANNQITYTAAGGGNDLITVNGVNSTTGLDVNGNIVKVASSALNQGTVSINDGYILALGDDVTAPKTTAAGWTLNGSVAIYKTASTTAGYSLVNNQIVYTEASGGDTLATISGVKSTNGLSLNGNVVTLSASALGSNNVSVSNGYTLNLANDVPLSQTTAAGWTLDGTTAKYKSMSTTTGYTLNNNQVIYTAASGGENLVTLKGIKSTKGLTLNGNVVTVAKSSLNNEKITINGGYTLALANDVSSPETKKAAWTKISNSSSTYKSSYKTAGYTLASNGKSISYSSATAAKELATVKGIKSTSGLSVSGKKITVSKASLNAKKVTVSDDSYKLALGSDVTKSKTSKAWSLSKSTATYKQSTTTGYSLADNVISYTKKATTTTLATVKGAKSNSGLKASGQKITLKNSALSKKVTVSGGYEFDFQSDYKSATITGSGSADTITARGSKISVNGGKGDDTIKIIGSGTVTGGAGSDVFYYKSSGKNVISDYAASDKISIASGTAKVSTSGSDVVFTVGKGKITVTGGVDKTITYIEKGEEKTHKGIAEYLDFNTKGTAVTLKAGYTAGNFTPSEYSDYANKLVTIDASKVKNPLTITGNKKSNVIIGSGDDDYISGELGADKISGGDGNDTLVGGAGNDKLYGGKGDDSLWGGAGTDTLFGEDGSDTFVYKKGDGKMIIADFEGEKIDTIMVLSDKVDGYSADSSNIIFNLHSGGQIVVQGGADKSINVVDKNDNILKHYNPTK